MLALFWTVGLSVAAVWGAAKVWRHLADDESSMDLAFYWLLAMLAAFVLLSAIQRELLVTGVWRWWGRVLPAGNTSLTVLTAVLLTLGTWFAMLLALLGAGAGVANGLAFWRRHRSASVAAAVLIARAAHGRAGGQTTR